MATKKKDSLASLVSAVLAGKLTQAQRADLDRLAVEAEQAGDERRKQVIHGLRVAASIG